MPSPCLHLPQKSPTGWRGEADTLPGFISSVFHLCHSAARLCRSPKNESLAIYPESSWEHPGKETNILSKPQIASPLPSKAGFLRVWSLLCKPPPQIYATWVEKKISGFLGVCVFNMPPAQLKNGRLETSLTSSGALLPQKVLHVTCWCGAHLHSSTEGLPHSFHGDCSTQWGVCLLLPSAIVRALEPGRAKAEAGRRQGLPVGS